jgi:hypothetical protein
METTMPTYNVHLYREMRLFFPGIEAESPEQAARLAGDKDFDDANDFSDCDGENLAALVDLVGDEDFSKSIIIDLDPMKASAEELYDALIIALPYVEGALDDEAFKKGAVCKDVKVIRAAIAKAQGETLKEAA